jgi:2-polyprenyl-6-hydroxyphenyl methylase/3-demethylubiquinone-9 3-methyltransferase
MTAVHTSSGEAFAFGANWRRFLESVDESRIAAAVDSLQQMLGGETCRGARFLDAGCGSGLFSLAAARLGADVRSFDVDAQSVAATREIQRRFGPADAAWEITSGSLLDPDFLAGLGDFDVVYSWGVVHHTGEMWRAIELLQRRVAPGGLLWLAIYNDQGPASDAWRHIKRCYNALPAWLRWAYVVVVGGLWLTYRILRRAGQLLIGTLMRWLSFRSPIPSVKETYARLGRSAGRRGMHWWYDLVDWIGGWPFEVAKPEEVLAYLRDRGFELVQLRTCGGNIGCNEYVFRRCFAAAAAVSPTAASGPG